MPSEIRGSDNFDSDSVGKVLQVVQTHYTTPAIYSVTQGVRTEISGVSVSITPSSASSKILIMINWNGEDGRDSGHNSLWGINRSGTAIGNPPDTDGNRGVGIAITRMGYYDNNNDSTPESVNVQYLDSPNTTSAVTYTLTTMNKHTAGSVFTNRVVNNADVTYVEKMASNIIVMEVGA